MIEMSTLGRTDRTTSGSSEDVPLLNPSADDLLHTNSVRRRITAGDVDVVSLGNYSRYDDFHTIDWVRDRNRDRLRSKNLQRTVRQGGWRDKLSKLYDASSGWLVVFLVGLASGFAAGIIDIGTMWMSDLKLGVCSENFYYNKEACCFQSNETSFDDDHCSAWHTWSELLMDKNTGSGTYALNYVIYIGVAAFFGTLCVWLVKTFAPYACGSGIPEVKTILSGFVIHGYLGLRTLFIKSLTIMMAVAAGLSLGKEGPLVHVACCCGNIFVRLFPKYNRNEAKKREVLSAAAAAGVSVAFGAPIGGVLFSLEEVSYYFPHKTMWRSFFSALTAAFVLQYMHPYQTDHVVMFYANYTTPWHFFELVPFLFLGIFGGVFGAIFIKCNLKWCKMRKTTKLGQYPIAEVIAVTLITAVLAYPNEYTRISASELIATLVRSCGPADHTNLCDYNMSTTGNVNDRYGPIMDGAARSGVLRSLWLLALAMLFKGFITIFTFGIKVPSGLFIPSMAVGACIGRIVGVGMQQLAWFNRNSNFFLYFCPTAESCIEPGLYAMVGAAATLGGVTRMTVSLVVIMFELTGGLNYIVPLMVAIMTSKWVGDAFGQGGIYDGHIILNGYPFLDSKEEFEHVTLACDVMRPRPNEPPLSTISANNTTVGDLDELLEETEYKGFPVVLDKASQLLEGFITRTELKSSLDQVSQYEGITSASFVYFTRKPPRMTDPNLPDPLSLKPILDESPFQISDQTPMETVVEMFRKMGLRQALVVRNGRLLGIITKKDVLRHIDQLNRLDPDSQLFR